MDGEQAVANATCKVEREEEDDWTGDTEWVEVKANADGAYELSKFETYRYTIKAEGYEDVVTNYYAVRKRGDDCGSGSDEQGCRSH